MMRMGLRFLSTIRIFLALVTCLGALAGYSYFVLNRSFEELEREEIQRLSGSARERVAMELSRWQKAIWSEVGGRVAVTIAKAPNEDLVVVWAEAATSDEELNGFLREQGQRIFDQSSATQITGFSQFNGQTILISFQQNDNKVDLKLQRAAETTLRQWLALERSDSAASDSHTTLSFDFPDLLGTGSVRLVMEEPLKVAPLARKAIGAMLIGLAIAGLILLLVTLSFIEKKVVLRVLYLCQRVLKIGNTHLVGERIIDMGADEIGLIAANINLMLSRIEDRDAAIRMILENASQGILLVQRDGRVANDFSRACIDIFQQNPKGVLLWELFVEEADKFRQWIPEVFNFEDTTVIMANLPPQVPIRGRQFQVDYRVVPGHDGTAQNLLLALTDVSATSTLLSQAYTRQRLQDRHRAIQSEEERFVAFVREMRHLSEQVDQRQHHDALLDSLRLTSSSFFLEELTEAIDVWKRVVAIDFNDFLFRLMVDDLNFVLNHLVQEISSELKVTHQLEHYQVDQTWPFLFNRSNFIWLEGLLRSQARHQHKMIAAIEWRVEGDLNANAFLPMTRALVYILFNVIDHGIESPDEREKSGKRAGGKVIISVEELSQDFRLTVRDDGRGVDLPLVRERLRQQGQVAPEDNVKALQAIFNSRFTVLEQATETAGTGIGLDVVSEEAQRVGGRAFAANHPGQGLEIIIEFPKPASL